MNRLLMNNVQVSEESPGIKEEKQESVGTDLNFHEEMEQLEEIKEKLNKALDNYDKSIEQYDKDYKDFKFYLADYRHEIDPKEIFQNEIALKQIERSGIQTVQIRDQIRKLVDSPYFARIDFREEGCEESSIFYIGRFSFTMKEESKILIFDWRAPVSSMFYDCELGKAGYRAPIGRINGEITRKRQLKITRGQIEYVLESSIQIQDDVLQRELSSTSDEKMKTIISTIQREQNRIIRNELSDTLIIQGVAGSGKTSIALHRIAYLLYRYKETLSANNVVILSPNKVFADYISNVLPELGEEPIYEMSFADIAEIQLEGIIQFESDRDPLETDDPFWADRAKFKSSIDFVDRMDEYLDYAICSYFEPDDYEFGSFKATREWILMRYNAYRDYPVKKRLYEVSADIHDKFYTENFREEELPRQKSIYRKLSDMFRYKNTLELYQDFFRVMNIPDKIVMPGKKTLEWSDVYPFLYFHAAFEGLRENQLIRHIVIDEMQDYTPIQYAVINKLFHCKKTILGDFGQSLNPNNRQSLNDLKTLYQDADVVELNKSYRSTYEIMTFAKKILNLSALVPVERHGDIPEIIDCTDIQYELMILKEKIRIFQANDKATLGIIVKTNSQAKELYQILSGNCELHLLTPDSCSFEKGITVTSIQMSKGLEFDEVIILSADRETYQTEYDRKLLYIACTRAMHRLTFLYAGEMTELLK